MGDELVVGRVTGVFGVRGDVRLAADAADALRVGVAVCLQLEHGGELRTELVAIRAHGKGFVARFSGCTDATAARALRGARVVIPRASLPRLGRDAYRQAELVGLQVIDTRLGALGEVKEVRHYPSCDMLVVGRRRVLVPMLHAYAIEIDAATQTIRVTLPHGFEELG